MKTFLAIDELTDATLASGKFLPEVVDILRTLRVNDYHTIITEFDGIDDYSADVLGSQRLFEIEEGQEEIEIH